MAAQGDLAFLVLVVGIAGGHRAQRRFGLDVHEALVVVDVVDRLGRIHDLPHDHRGDLDRAAVEVVDLELAALEVAHAQADLRLAKKGLFQRRPLSLTVPTYLPNRLSTAAWLGSTMYRPNRQNEGDQVDQQAADDPAAGRAADAVNDQVAADQQHGQQHEQHRDAGSGADGVLFHDGLACPGWDAESDIN